MTDREPLPDPGQRTTDLTPTTAPGATPPPPDARVAPEPGGRRADALAAQSRALPDPGQDDTSRR